MDTVNANVVIPPFRYVGSKIQDLDKIILPIRKTYVEVFGGTGAVLLNRPRSEVDVYCDINPEITNVYTQVRDNADELVDMLRFVMVSRKLFIRKPPTSDVARAADWLHKRNISFSGCGSSFSRPTKTHNSMSSAMRHRFSFLRKVSQRLQGVQILNIPYQESIQRFDSPDTVFYFDLPYVGIGHVYGYRLTDYQQEEFIERVRRCHGFCVISGYAHPIYDKYSWNRTIEWSKRVSCQIKAAPAKEKLWIFNGVADR